MTSRSFAKVKVIFEWSPKINGVPTPDMEWSIRRAISMKNYAEKARFIIVTCGWHKGGHPEDAYPDPLEHCTFKVLDAEKKFVVTLHGHPERVIPEGVATKVEWRQPSNVRPMSRFINDQLRKASGMPGTSGIFPRGSTIVVENGLGQGTRRRPRPTREANVADQSSSKRIDISTTGKRLGETMTRPQATKPPIQDELVASTAQLSLKQGTLTAGSALRTGGYIPPHRRNTNSSLPNPAQVADTPLLRTGGYIPPHRRNANSSFPKVTEGAATPQRPVEFENSRSNRQGTIQDPAVDGRANAKPYATLDREPLTSRSTNRKMASKPAEPQTPQKQDKEGMGPNDCEQDRKGKLGRK